MIYIMARVDISGPVPVVVSVNHYSSENICLDYSKYRMWTLAQGETLEEAKENIELELHDWALPFLKGDIKIPHGGR